MKKSVFILFIVFLMPFILHAETTSLKLRASKSPGSVRIVFEGPEPVINKGSVTRKENDLLVTFPGIGISIQAGDQSILHSMINKETVMLSPGDFSGMKVFTLREPPRLVIDVYSQGGIGIAPDLSAQQKEAESSLSRIKTVVIDPGHGGYEHGIATDDYIEKNMVLDIARKLGALINRGTSHGFLTRGSDSYMTLGERVNFTNNRSPDVFISLHIGEHRDIVVYSPVVTDRPSDIVNQYLQNRGQSEYENESLDMLKAVSEAVIAEFGEDMLSVRPLPYTILSRIQAAALIIELPSYEDASYDEDYNSKIADTIFKGLINYEETSVR